MNVRAYKTEVFKKVSRGKPRSIDYRKNCVKLLKKNVISSRRKQNPHCKRLLFENSS